MPPNTLAAIQGTLQESPPPSPLATSYITNYDGQLVTYWYVDSNTHQRVTATCAALDFISHMVPHIPPKGMQTMRYAGLYARNIKRKIAPTVRAALDALRLQAPLFDLEPLVQTLQRLKVAGRGGPHPGPA